MSMTPEEAIESVCYGDWINILMLHLGDDDINRLAEAMCIIGNALCPITREQVEKVFPGCRSCKSCRSCVFSIHAIKDMPCKKCDPNAEGVLTEYKPSNFCPVCGKPLTDEAVQMVMERMEALRDE